MWQNASWCRVIPQVAGLPGWLVFWNGLQVKVRVAKGNRYAVASSACAQDFIQGAVPAVRNNKSGTGCGRIHCPLSAEHQVTSEI